MKAGRNTPRFVPSSLWSVTHTRIGVLFVLRSPWNVPSHGWQARRSDCLRVSKDEMIAVASSGVPSVAFVYARVVSSSALIKVSVASRTHAAVEHAGRRETTDLSTGMKPEMLATETTETVRMRLRDRNMESGNVVVAHVKGDIEDVFVVS
eukprot:CAMPEP_0205903852 /NCGR_PEP_ID=MMETSP1325-20131115/359_1 /ASSEMBLY_ACC=CAM_ASM_000708 /TAXON_ID=236786 /ORGANISM="Florenciella sp., Strain RCC1007" /LENGTH=150 /DNA_ID=CAMNT_0053269549 /DNA_START=53 /DNA_END=505 /DNA_ORIENTATION=+